MRSNLLKSYLHDAILLLLVVGLGVLLRDRLAMQAQITELQVQVVELKQQVHSVLVESHRDSLAITTEPTPALNEICRGLAQIALLHPDARLRLRSQQKQLLTGMCDQLQQVETSYQQQSAISLSGLSNLLDAQQQAYCTSHADLLQRKQNEISLYAGGNLHLALTLLRRYATDVQGL